MADTITIELSGGPCGGEHKKISPAKLRTHFYVCEGTTYLYDRPFPDGGGYFFTDAAELRARTAKTRAIEPHAVASAWSRLTRALGHTGPQQLRRQQAANARLRRIAR